jgi:hypothetical protein
LGHQWTMMDMQNCCCCCAFEHQFFWGWWFCIISISKCLTAALVSCFFLVVCVGQEWNWTCVWWSGLDIGHPGRHNMFPDSFNLEGFFWKIIHNNDYNNDKHDMNFTCAVGIWMHDTLLTFADASGEAEDICLIGVGDDGHFESLYPGRHDRYQVWAVSWPCWPREFYDSSLFGIYSHGYHDEWQIIVRNKIEYVLECFLAYVVGTSLTFHSVMGTPVKQPVITDRTNPQDVLENPHSGSQKTMLQ